jgi:histidinol phosphatase-like enzyme (inositol monophosphatase family)
MSLNSNDLQSRLDFALAVAREASDLILRYYQHPELAVERKGDESPVTAADRGAEELIRARLAVAFPADGVLGEEFPEKPGTSGFRWILDPVDGTKSFVHGVPLFGTLIGVEHLGQCVIGVCRFPALDEVVYAATGKGAWWQTGSEPARRAQVSSVTELKDALFCQTNFLRWETVGRWQAMLQLLRSVGLARGWGDCYGHILVATGRAEIMVDPSLNPWDAAALVPILQEAGGCFVDWTGETTIYGGNGISVVPALKSQVLNILNQTD